MLLVHKKGITKETLVVIIIVLVSFFLITWVIYEFFGKAEGKTAESVCSFSIAAKDLTTLNLKVTDVSLMKPLCKTQDITLPEAKEDDKEKVKKEVADLIARCWHMFGEGQVPDVFKKGDFYKNNCFICYTASIRKTNKFKEEISANDFELYLKEKPYIVKEDDDNCNNGGGFCISNEEECKNLNKNEDYPFKFDEDNEICKKKSEEKKNCCYIKYDCMNRGGICKNNNYESKEYVKYDKWKCPKDLKCFIKKENYFSYTDYVKKYGKGGYLIAGRINIGETYAIAFSGPTKECDTCTTTAGIVGVMGILSGVGTIPTLILAGSGWVADYGIRKLTDETKDQSGVYIVPLNQIKNHCSLQKDISGK